MIVTHKDLSREEESEQWDRELNDYYLVEKDQIPAWERGLENCKYENQKEYKLAVEDSLSHTQKDVGIDLVIARAATQFLLEIEVTSLKFSVIRAPPNTSVKCEPWVVTRMVVAWVDPLLENKRQEKKRKQENYEELVKSWQSFGKKQQ
jgi:hypothetical protein